MSVNDNNATEAFQPVVLKTAQKDPEDIEMIPVFELDGDLYQVEKKPSAGLSLAYLEMQATRGADYAVYWMMVKLFGQEGYDALKNHPDLEQDDLLNIINFLENHILGGGQGNSSGGGGKSRHRVSKK